VTWLWPLVWTCAAFAAATIGALTLRRVLLAAMPRWAPPETVSAAVGALRGPSLWWCVVIGLYVASEIVEDYAFLPRRWHRLLLTGVNVAFVLSVTVTLAGLAGSLVSRAAERRLVGVAVTGLAQTATRAMVFVVGTLVLLSTVGVQITPILTTLGIGGVAVALALQDTLSNLFAGIHLLADSPLRVGDHVKIGGNVEGFVIDVGWRSTRIRALSNDIVVVPNLVVARETITNYDLSDVRGAFRLRISVDDSADPDTVATVLRDEIDAASAKIPGLLPYPPPTVTRLFGAEGSLDFAVSYHVAALSDQFRVQHELRRRVLERLQRENIAIRGPARVA
jgi:small-conductance mechanosensitive channel